MRVVLIDPYKKTVSEYQLKGFASSNSAAGAIYNHTKLEDLLKNKPTDFIKLDDPVSNSSTGDTLFVNAAPPTRAPKWTFMGDTFKGKAVIVGRKLIIDAVVPIERVQGQVKFGR